MNHFYPDWTAVFEDDNAPILMAQELTEWFDKYENNVHFHRLAESLLRHIEALLEACSCPTPF